MTTMKQHFHRLQTILTTPHIEVTLRMTLSMLLSYIAVFANVPYITPIETAPLMGILVPFLVMLFPTLTFSFGSLTLPVFSLFLYCFVSSSALLAIAARYGTAAYIVMFGIWAFWNCTSLRWNKSEGSKVSIILIAVVFQTVLIWPSFVTVQDGFTVPDASLLPNTQAVLLEYLADTVAIATSMGVGTHQLTIQSGVLQGIVAQVTIPDPNTAAEASTYLPGGMWLVKGAWTYSGVNNPLASYQNMFVFTCWLIVFVGLAVLLPPARTIRSAVWRGMIPAALKDTAGMLRLHVENVTKEGDEEDDDDVTKQNSRTKIAQLHGKCIYHMNSLFNGTLAKYTVFEPRLMTNPCTHPPEFTTMYLAQLSVLVARASAAAVGIQLFTSREFCYDNLSSGVYSNAADKLDVCAKALATGNAGFLDDDTAKTCDFLNDVEDIAGGDGEDETSAKNEDAFEMNNRVEQITAVSRKWLSAMSESTEKDVGCCSNESLGAMVQNLKPVSDERLGLTDHSISWRRFLSISQHFLVFFHHCNLQHTTLVDHGSLLTLHPSLQAPFRTISEENVAVARGFRIV